MLSMSVEHANQLRQLIVEKHRPQPAGLANVYSLIIIYYSQCTIRQPKVIFLHMPAGKHKKNFISWDSQCLSHYSPWTSRASSRGQQKYNETSFWYNYHMHYSPTRLGFSFDHRSWVRSHSIVNLHTSQKTPDQQGFLSWGSPQFS